MRVILTDEQRAYIVAHYPNTSSKAMAEHLGISLNKLYAHANALGVSKSLEYVANVTREKWKTGAHENSRKAHFSKGHAPANKGKRQEEFMSAEAIERTKQTRFKKGQAPHNAYSSEHGVVSVRKDKSGRSYQWVKLAHGNWKMLHVVIWESENGPVPKGHMVVFKNKDSMDARLSNLELVDRAEHMRRNTIHNLPEELKENIRLVTRINRKVKKLNSHTT